MSRAEAAEPLRERQEHDHGETSDSEHDREEKHPIECPLHETERSECREAGVSRVAARRGQLGHGLGMREPRKTGQENERVAVGAQRIDERSQRGDGLRAIASAIMQQHDTSAASLLEWRFFVALEVQRIQARQRSTASVDHVADDLIGSGLAPVVGVNVQSDRHVTEIARDSSRHQFVCRGRLRISEIRWTKEAGASRQHCLENSCRGIELEPGYESARERKIRMTKRVVSHLVSFARDASRERDVLLHVLADHEECRRRPICAEGVQDHARPRRIRAVVERQRHAVWNGAGARDQPRRRIDGHALVGHEPRRAIDG